VASDDKLFSLVSTTQMASPSSPATAPNKHQCVVKVEGTGGQASRDFAAYNVMVNAVTAGWTLRINGDGLEGVMVLDNGRIDLVEQAGRAKFACQADIMGVLVGEGRGKTAAA